MVPAIDYTVTKENEMNNDIYGMDDATLKATAKQILRSGNIAQAARLNEIEAEIRRRKRIDKEAKKSKVA